MSSLSLLDSTSSSSSSSSSSYFSSSSFSSLFTSSFSSFSSSFSSHHPSLPPQHSTTQSGRVPISVEKPFIYGSAGFFLGKPLIEGAHSHRWICFVRGLEHEDLSYLFSRVVFTLHASFTQPVRVVTQAPFQVTETGWGEFTIQIALHFREVSLPPVILQHQLKLFPPPGTNNVLNKPVMSEMYDELVFNQPSLEWYQVLKRGALQKVQGNEELLPFYTTKAFAKAEEAQLRLLVAKRDEVAYRTREERHRLWNVGQSITRIIENGTE